ncbi:MAG: hypothetical protein ACTSWG_03140 [Candidatus Helarchaeota archaeon]
MRKLIFLTILMSFLTAGCSFLPRLTMDTEGTVPKSTQKAKAKNTCKGEAKFNENGDMVYCSRGFYLYEEDYNKAERKMTFTEKIKSFINKLVGFGFWGLILLVIFVPSLAGVAIGRIIEGTIGITGKALKSVVSGVQQARKNGKDLNNALANEQDADVKKYIRRLKEKENIK